MKYTTIIGTLSVKVDPPKSVTITREGSAGIQIESSDEVRAIRRAFDDLKLERITPRPADA